MRLSRECSVKALIDICLKIFRIAVQLKTSARCEKKHRTPLIRSRSNLRKKYIQHYFRRKTLVIYSCPRCEKKQHIVCTRLPLFTHAGMYKKIKHTVRTTLQLYTRASMGKNTSSTLRTLQLNGLTLRWVNHKTIFHRNSVPYSWMPSAQFHWR